MLKNFVLNCFVEAAGCTYSKKRVELGVPIALNCNNAQLFADNCIILLLFYDMPVILYCYASFCHNNFIILHFSMYMHFHSI